MSDIVIERAIYHREGVEAPRLMAQSPGLAEELLAPLAAVLVAFGERPPGVVCRGAVFAQPIGESRVAVVQVDDGSSKPTGASLEYSVLVLTRTDYGILGGDPVELARRIPPISTHESVLTAIPLPAELLAKRGLEQVRAVLSRVRPHANANLGVSAAEGDLTIENAESPILLGAAQALVSGDRLAFERSHPDPSLISALWTLLPNRLRPSLWPATFAFSNALHFDVVVLPRMEGTPLEGYTLEDQAGDYPEGNYELSLQSIAELGDEATLEAVFAADATAFEPTAEHRSRADTKRLLAKFFIGLMLLVSASQMLRFRSRNDSSERAATAASIVGVRDPWTALTMLEFGNRLYLKR